MADTVEKAAPGPSPRRGRPSSWADWVRFGLRGLGQLLITAGVIVLLFVVYEVYVTNFFAHREQHEVQTALRTEWQHDVTAHRRDPLLALPGSTGPRLPDGTGIAFLYIPRLGSDYSWAIVQGISNSDLEKGPGHYPWTQLPGQVGNFAVAGHRVGKGEPFLNLDHLQPGDPVIVQTQSRWFVYTVLGSPDDIEQAAAGSPYQLPGREIVDPGDGVVVDPVPNDPTGRPRFRLMTMTTCNPKFTAENRMVVFARLTRTVSAGGSLAMPAALRHQYYAQTTGGS